MISPDWRTPTAISSDRRHSVNSVPTSDTWIDLDEGYVVFRAAGPKAWSVSWYPYDKRHPDYPGHTLSPDDPALPSSDDLEAIIRWACAQYGGARRQPVAA
jgi:hypothetical protein